MKLLRLLPLFGMAGCVSGTKGIARENNDIEQSANAIADAAVEIEQTHPDLYATIMKHVLNILESSQDISVYLTKVKDIIPWWATLLNNWILVIGAVLLVGVLAYLGVLPILRRLVGLIGVGIPKATRRNAAMSAEAVVTQQATPMDRERIAAQRAADPMFESEFKREKKRLEKKNARSTGPESTGEG